MNTTSPLLPVLERFRDRVNAHARLPLLLRGWSRSIVVEALDTGDTATLIVRDTKITEVLGESREDPEHPITVQGDLEMLCGIFDGTANPAQAVLDGGLAVYGADTDQVKLDAITLIVWGTL